MISESEARKAYGSNIEVIRKGDKRWTSDNHLAGRQGENYGMNPTSKMEQGIAIARRNHRIEPAGDPNELPVGTRDFTGDGRDLFEWVVAEEADRKRVGTVRVWRFRATHKNGAL